MQSNAEVNPYLCYRKKTYNSKFSQISNYFESIKFTKDIINNSWL